DPDLDMFVISRSTHRHQQHAEVVPVSHIIHSCHLVLNFGHTIDLNWTTDNVNIMCDQFHINPYIDMHMLCLLKLWRKNSI
ncbi:hypothetical protein BD769DRAFT_1370614, partial [Suillus cothurnatus]